MHGQIMAQCSPTSRATEFVDFILMWIISNLQNVGWGAKPVVLTATRATTRSDKRAENLAMVELLIAMARIKRWSIDRWCVSRCCLCCSALVSVGRGWTVAGDVLRCWEASPRTWNFARNLECKNIECYVRVWKNSFESSLTASTWKIFLDSVESSQSSTQNKCRRHHQRMRAFFRFWPSACIGRQWSGIICLSNSAPISEYSTLNWSPVP